MTFAATYGHLHTNIVLAVAAVLCILFLVWSFRADGRQHREVKDNLHTFYDQDKQ